ncbi:hypothetical protein [Streptomyces sp. NPDC049881]|uniref:hypothetical protein n=1 Tax=Streptomyces sp. NPDC049881 TaxID=3155778 RepID=UPI00342BF2FC
MTTETKRDRRITVRLTADAEAALGTLLADGAADAADAVRGALRLAADMRQLATADAADDLAVLTSCGASAADVVRRAVALAADAVRTAYDYGDVPEGQPVTLLSARYALADGTPAPLPVVPPARQTA